MIFALTRYYLVDLLQRFINLKIIHRSDVLKLSKFPYVVCSVHHLSYRDIYSYMR